MEQAAILKSGRVVKLTGLLNPKYTIYGFLTSFEAVVKEVKKVNGVIEVKEVRKKFRETLKENFRDIDLVGQINQDVVGGFYEEDFFLEYLIDKNKLYQLKDHRYDFKAASAKDEIIVKKLKVASPYTDFCKIETYKWKYEPNTQIIDYGTWQIKIPTGVVPDPVTGVNVQLSSTSMQFYNHKIGLFITPLTDVNEKQAKAFLFAKMAILINSIENIFNLIELGTTSDFGQYINSQKSEWSTQPIFVNPTIEILEDYMRNLTSFYEGFYSNQISIKKAPKKEQFYWLARCLSAQALATVPTNDKVDLLENISDYSHRLTESNKGEELAIKIIESFTFDSVSAEDRNLLLDRLMKIQTYQVANVYKQTNTFDTKQTLFEILYYKIDDNRSGRYSDGAIPTNNNRKSFIFMLYKIWKISKYNPKFHDPSYTEGANIFGIYPESYYMKLVAKNSNGNISDEYYNPDTSPAILVYNASTVMYNNIKLTTTDTDYIIGDLEGRKIKIHKQKTIITTTFDFDNYDYEQDTDVKTPLYGIYDLYQPISIIGFRPDLDLIETFENPDTQLDLNDRIPSFPVFLLYYMVDYTKLKKIDFGLLAVKEIALNFTGVGALNDLKYLGYLSKARSVWAGTASASETVLFWKAVEGFHNTITFTADNLATLNSYTNNTTTDKDVKEFTDKTGKLFDAISMGALVSDQIMKKKLFGAAEDVLTQERKLISLGKSHGLNNDVMNAIKSIYDVESLTELMQLKLQNLPSYASDKILIKFNDFTLNEKYDFFTYFYNIKEESKWTKMNFQYSQVINGNIEVYTWVDLWKNEIKFLKNYRTYEFLESFHIIKTSNNLHTEIFKGRSGKILKPEFINILPHQDNHYIWQGKGVHHKDALQINGTGGTGRIITGTKKLIGPEGLGYYEAKVEIYNSDFTSNAGWKVKNSKGGKSTFFPDKWSKERLQEELALAFKNRKIKNGLWKGKASDGVDILFHFDNNGTITTAHPSFK